MPCNGRYTVEATARTTENNGVLEEETATLDRIVDVVVPPDDVASIDAVEGEDRAVTVTWSPIAPVPADHLGYTVVRTDPDGTVAVTRLGDITSFHDAAPPAAGGDTTYAVRARRPGATDDSVVHSPNAASKVVTVSPAPTPDPGTDGGTGGTGGTGGGATGGTTGGATGGTGGGTTGGAGRPASGVRVPRVGTPSRNFFPPLLSPPNAVDTGFEEELPYEDRELGAEDAVLPDDLASGPLDQAPGRGLVIPLATGLVLAVWALHLRFLARAAKPEYLEPVDDRVEIVLY